MTTHDRAIRGPVPFHQRPGTVVLVLSGLAIAAAVSANVAWLWFAAAAGAAYSLAASP